MVREGFGDVHPGSLIFCEHGLAIKIDPKCDFAVDKNLYSFAVGFFDGILIFICPDTLVEVDNEL